MLVAEPETITVDRVASVVAQRRTRAFQKQVASRAVLTGWHLGRSYFNADFDGPRTLWHGPVTITCRLPRDFDGCYVLIDAMVDGPDGAERQRVFSCTLDRLPAGYDPHEAHASGARPGLVDVLRAHRLDYDPSDIEVYVPGDWEDNLESLVGSALPVFQQWAYSRVIEEADDLARRFGFAVAEDLPVAV